MESFSDLTRSGTGKSAFDSDTVTKIATDFSNSTVAFNTITDGTRTFSYTPPANSDFEVEAWLLLQTPTATILPRVGVSVGAGQQYGAISVEQVGAAVTAELAQHATFLAALTTLQIPVGGTPTAGSPYEAIVRIKGRSGATPGPILIQMASETAGTACLVRGGSRMTARTLA